MKKRMLIELDYDADYMHGDNKDAIEWFCSEVLTGGLLLHSEVLGDYIGTIKVLDKSEELKL